MRQNVARVFAIFLSTLHVCGFATQSALDAPQPDLAGDYIGYIISTLQPGTKMVGKNTLSQDGTFAYTGNNGVKVSGKMDTSNPRQMTGVGATLLPKAFGFLQMKYPDGAVSVPLTFRGSYANGVFKGTYSSRYEQGLFHFVPANGSLPSAPVESDPLGIFLLPPDDLPYKNTADVKPVVIVLPGDFTSDASFAEEVSATTLADTAEAELKRAGFDVIERANFSSSVGQLRAAFAGGAQDSTSSAVMQMGKMKDVKWIVYIDMQSATKINQASPPTGKRPEPSKKGNDADKFIAILGVVGELADQRTVDLWKLNAKYRVVDRNTAKTIHQGNVEDILMTTQTVSNTLVSYTALRPDVSFHMMMRRIVQLAVLQMDDLLASR